MNYIKTRPVRTYNSKSTKINAKDGGTYVINYASENHVGYVQEIVKNIEAAARVKGTGIAKRSHDYIKSKILEGKATIALKDKEFAGFCYIESWGHQKFVANSGLIVPDKFRGQGLAKAIKYKAFELSREKFPHAKLFGLTTNLAVMRINSELGYIPVTFSELTNDDEFWKGCEGCSYFDILQRTERSHCLCTAMIYDPIWEKNNTNSSNNTEKAWTKIKNRVSKNLNINRKNNNT